MSNTKRAVIFITSVSLIWCCLSTVTAISRPIVGRNDSSISLRTDNAIAVSSINFDNLHFRGKRSSVHPLVQKVVQKVSPSGKIKEILKWGARKIFPGFFGNVIAVMLDIFFPTEEPASVWHEVKDQFKKKLDRETSATVQALLLAKTRAFHLKLKPLARELKENQNVSAHYMALVWDMIGLEAQFVIPDTHHSAKTLNRDLLQLYSNIVSMKATYYSLGVRCRERIGLTEQEVRNVKSYFGDTVRGADEHVSKTFKDLRSYTDDEKYAETMYLRNEMRDHGYIAIWENMLVNEGHKVYLDELRFSSNFGRLNASDGDRILDLANQTLTPPRSTTARSHYGQLRELTVYHKSGDSYFERQPVGFQMVFEPADETRLVGHESPTNVTFDVGKTFRLTKIKGYSWGDGPVHGLKLTFTDIEANAVHTYSFGCESSTDEQQRLFLFEKVDYYIAAVYATPYQMGDVKGLGIMSVSYLPLKSRAADDANDDGMVDWKCDQK